MLRQLITISILFYCSTAFYAGQVRLDDGTKHERQSPDVHKKKKINAVLFFADTKADEDYCNSSGLDCLKMGKKPEVKHCTEYSSNVIQRARRSYRFRRHTCTCYHRLQEGIISLLNYAQNALGMVTALGSLSNHSFSNSIRYGNTEIQVNDRIETSGEPAKKSTGIKAALANAPLSSSLKIGENVATKNPSVISSKEQNKIRKIPLLNVFPKDSPPPFYAFTDAEERKKRSEGPYIMAPEHTEIFRIRTRRDMPMKNNPKEINEASYLNREQNVKTIFDIMDIMSNLQRSLFGTMLQEDSDIFSHERNACPLQSNLIRKIRQPGLFEVVQKTLYSVIQASETTGFLMIIIGGQLSDISSSHSPLVQSIKHVIENTDEESTLIVLTGMCPNSPDATVKVPCEELNKKNLPLFAMGPGSDEFSSCYELYDVPLTVKRILTRSNSKHQEQESKDLEIPMHPRSKRNILDMYDDEDEYEDSDYMHFIPKRAAKTSGATAGGAKEKSKSSAHNIHDLYIYKKFPVLTYVPVIFCVLIQFTVP